MTVAMPGDRAAWAWIGATALMLLPPAWAQTAPEGGKYAPPQQRPIQGTGVRHVVTTLAPVPLLPITLILPPPPVAGMAGGRGESAPASTAAGALTGPDSPSPRPGPDLTPDRATTQGLAPAPVTDCVVVSLSAPRARPDKTWMDLTGDGLIVSAVDTRRVESALGGSGPAAGRTAGPVRHCMAPAVLTALLAPVPPAAGAGTLALVPIDGGWRLAAPDDRQPTPPPPPGRLRAPAR